MRVIYSVGSTFGGTGIGNTAYRAVSGIYKAGHLYRLICLDYKKTEIPREKIIHFRLLKYSVWYPLKAVQRYVVQSFNPYVFLDRLYDTLSLKYIEKCDIFHGWRGHSKKAAKKAKKLGAIVIVENASSHPLTQHNLLKEEYARYGINFLPFTKTRLKSALEELEFADYILVPSDFAYQSFIENNVPKEKLIKIPFGVDYENYNPKKRKKDDTFRAIFVGSIQLRKGIQYLLQAWDELKLKNAELLIIGRIWPDAKKIVEKYKANSTIKFVGFTNPKKYYEISDVFVFPSIEEGSALVTYEAMAAGLPLIVTFNSGSIIRDKKEGFVIPIRNVDMLKEKILYFYNNPDKREKMGMAARRLVENYSWEKYGENLVKAYERVVKNGRGKIG